MPAAKKTSTWSFPGRGECQGCHTAAAGGTLGLELAQLNREITYPSTGRRSNQLATLDHIGVFSAALAAAPAALPSLPVPERDGPLEGRARAYLHANCSFCHRSDDLASGGDFDIRFATPFGATKTCNASPKAGSLGIDGGRVIAPGSPDASILLQRML